MIILGVDPGPDPGLMLHDTDNSAWTRPDSLADALRSKHDVLVYERYIVNSARGLSDTRAQQIALSQIGVLEDHAWKHGCRPVVQSASQIKAFWRPKRVKKMIPKEVYSTLTRHDKDAARHILHYMLCRGLIDGKDLLDD